MRGALLGMALLLSACATPWAQVKDATTIDEARALLGDYKPKVVPYPPDAEAWYFDRNECVLFVEGKLRLSTNSKTTRSSLSSPDTKREVPDSSQKQVLCAPSMLKR